MHKTAWTLVDRMTRSQGDRYECYENMILCQESEDLVFVVWVWIPNHGALVGINVIFVY